KIKTRLRNSPAAVPDDGIDLRRKMPAKHLFEGPPAAEPIPVQAEMIACTALRVTFAPFGYLSREGDPTINLIQNIVCKYYKVSMLDLKSARRTADVVRPRQVAMYLARV